MERLNKRFLLLALSGLLAACASGPFDSRAASPDEGDHRGDGEAIEIRVTNLNYSDARLWLVVRRGQKRSLGIVTGKDDDTFTVPWHFSAPVAIEIDLVGGGRCRSDQLTLDPGDWIDFRIPVAFQAGSSCRW